MAVTDNTKVRVGFKFWQPYPDTPFFRARKDAQGRPFVGKPHRGVDLAPKPEFRGQKLFIVAPVSGKIVFARWHNQFGWMVAIRTVENGIEYLHIMAHMAYLLKKVATEGNNVAKGEYLGVMGGSGIANAVHVHYQVEAKRPQGTQSHWWIEGSWKPIPPTPWLA